MAKTHKVILLCCMLIFVQVTSACGDILISKPTLEPTVIPTVTPAPTIPVTDTLATRIDQYIQDKHPDLSGTILVAQDGEILISRGYGLADREHEIPNTAQTKFEIGSITKSFTAMAIMILEERGLLNVADSICKYLSACPEAWEPVMIHHLLNHTSGIRNYSDIFDNQFETGIIDVDPCKEYSSAEVVSMFKDFPLKYAPGKHWRYTNSGYFLLGVIIENVSGDSYDEFLQKNIFQPLEMAETGYAHTHTYEKIGALGYFLDQDQIINAPCWDVSIKRAAGGLYSTVGDLYKWDQALYSDQLVSYETLDKMFTSDVRMRGGKTYGYGWMISKRKGHRIIEHPGALPGFLAQLARYPDEQVTIIVLKNLRLDDEDLQAIRISMGVADIVFEED